MRQPLDRGGLGVVEVSRKLSSLHITWVKRFLSGEYRGWQSFFHFYLRRTFLAEPINRVFGLSNVSEATLRRLLPFYRAVLTAWYAAGGTQTFGAFIVPRSNTDPLRLADVTAKTVYTILGKINYKQHRCIAKVRELRFGPVEWPRVWQNLNFLRHSRPALDTSWLIAHCILPTADRLIHFGCPWTRCVIVGPLKASYTSSPTAHSCNQYCTGLPSSSVSPDQRCSARQPQKNYGRSQRRHKLQPAYSPSLA